MSQPSEKPVKQNKSLLKNPFFWGAIIGMAILPVLRMLAMARRDAPAPLVEVETWQLRDSQNRLVSQESLNGKIVIFNLYYDDCSVECQNSFEMLGEVKKRFDSQLDNVEILSLPVLDIASDDGANGFSLDSIQKRFSWTFLGGSNLELKQILLEKMKLQSVLKDMGTLLAKEGTELQQTLILKRMADSGKLYLLDQNGDLRLAVDTQMSSLAGLVRAGLFLLEKGPDA